MKKEFTLGNGSTIVNSSWGVLTFIQIKPPLGYIGEIKDGDLDQTEELYSMTIKEKNNREFLRVLEEAFELLKNQVVLTGDLDITHQLKLEQVKFNFVSLKMESIEIVLKGIKTALIPKNLYSLA